MCSDNTPTLQSYGKSMRPYLQGAQHSPTHSNVFHLLICDYRVAAHSVNIQSTHPPKGTTAPAFNTATPKQKEPRRQKGIWEPVSQPGPLLVPEISLSNALPQALHWASAGKLTACSLIQKNTKHVHSVRKYAEMKRGKEAFSLDERWLTELLMRNSTQRIKYKYMKQTENFLQVVLLEWLSFSEKPLKLSKCPFRFYKGGFNQAQPNVQHSTQHI